MDSLCARKVMIFGHVWAAACHVIFHNAACSAMSLNSALQQVMRPAIPEPVLSLCSDDDRVLIENIMYLCLEVLPTLSLNLSTARKQDDLYLISIPFCCTGNTVSLQQLQQIQNYSPARVCDVSVCVQNEGSERPHCLVLEVCDGKTRVACTQFDVIRIKKRKV